MSYTPMTHVATGDLATAALHNTLLDNIGFIVGGLEGTGFAMVDLLEATLPSVSAAGHAKIAADSASHTIQASVNGSAFSELGGFLASNPAIISRHRNVIRG